MLSLLQSLYGDNVVSCAGIIGIKHRHNFVRDTLVDICFRSWILARKEVDVGLGGGCDKPLRPADMLLYSWDERLDVCVDLTGSSPLTQTGMVDFVPGHVVIDAAHRKRVKIEKVGKHLNKAKKKMDLSKGKEKMVMERGEHRTVCKGRPGSSSRNAAITKPKKPKSRSKDLAPTIPRTGSTSTTLLVLTKRPPPMMNYALGLAAVKTWQQILNMEF
ncbi:hypothetical protein Tco_0834948 [Tanacetum coccineum]